MNAQRMAGKGEREKRLPVHVPPALPAGRGARGVGFRAIRLRNWLRDHSPSPRNRFRNPCGPAYPFPIEFHVAEAEPAAQSRPVPSPRSQAPSESAAQAAAAAPVEAPASTDA